MSESGEDKIYFIVCGCISALGIVSFLILIHLTVTRYNLRARDWLVFLLACFPHPPTKKNQPYVVFFILNSELKARKREKEMMREREEAIAINTAASLDDFKAASKCNNEPGNKTNKRSSTWRLWLKVLPTAIAGFLILFSDVGVLTILTYVPSSTGTQAFLFFLLILSYSRRYFFFLLYFSFSLFLILFLFLFHPFPLLFLFLSLQFFSCILFPFLTNTIKQITAISL